MLAALDAPDWHGRNLDSLWDSLSGGDLNGVDAPFELVITRSPAWPPDVIALVWRIDDLFEEARASGTDIRLRLVGESDV